MRPIRPATKQRFLQGWVSVAGSLILAATGVSVSGQRTDQASQSPPLLDLTDPVPATQQGRGLPGATGGGGGLQTGSTDTSSFRLPLELRIVGASVGKAGDFVIEILLRNTGGVSFDLPALRDITKVEQPGNRSQRIFFFDVQPVRDGKPSGESVRGAATGGSMSVRDSFLRIAPGESLRILLPTPMNLLKRSLAKAADQVEVHVVCDEWTLEDDRYFIHAIADKLPSTNTVFLGFRNGKPFVAKR
jgi:hypothetical protein